jgi:hypothetical protein
MRQRPCAGLCLCATPRNVNGRQLATRKFRSIAQHTSSGPRCARPLVLPAVVGCFRMTPSIQHWHELLAAPGCHKANRVAMRRGFRRCSAKEAARTEAAAHQYKGDAVGEAPFFIDMPLVERRGQRIELLGQRNDSRYSSNRSDQSGGPTRSRACATLKKERAAPDADADSAGSRRRRTRVFGGSESGSSGRSTWPSKVA